MKDQRSATDDDTPEPYGPEYWAHFLDDLDEDDYQGGPHLITVDELRAAGALDVPPGWRKSLGVEPVQRDLFSGLSDDDPDEQQLSARSG